MNWKASVFTLFPDMFPGPLAYSLSGQALKKDIWSFVTHDLREFGKGKHKTVDDTPFGGGAGMMMRTDVLHKAMTTYIKNTDLRPRFYLSPRGKLFTQQNARDLVLGPGVILLCGRYEGIDERALDLCKMQEISIGDYILSGGELAAMVLLDTCVRLLPGVMGSENSAKEESFSNGLLEYPQYTRPAVYRGHSVPKILLSGHHAFIAQWRHRQSETITQSNRPDLWQKYIDKT